MYNKIILGLVMILVIRLCESYNVKISFDVSTHISFDLKDTNKAQAESASKTNWNENDNNSNNSTSEQGSKIKKDSTTSSVDLIDLSDPGDTKKSNRVSIYRRKEIKIC